MPFRFRSRQSAGPLRLNFTQRGLRSIAVKLGPFTYNLTHRRVTTDLPGGLYHQADLRPTTCRCGHPASVHEHYRAGDDCPLCDCTHYRRAKK
jgi:hypothetical protein